MLELNLQQCSGLPGGGAGSVGVGKKESTSGSGCTNPGPVKLEAKLYLEVPRWKQMSHPCLARVLVRSAGQNVAGLQLLGFFRTPGYTLSWLTGVWWRLGMLTQERQWLILVLKTDLSSIQAAEQRPNLPRVFCARCHDLHVRASLGPETKADNGQEWTLIIN